MLITCAIINKKAFLKIRMIALISGLLLASSLLHAETLRIAIPKDFYPYFSFDGSGKATGIIVDVWELWSSRTKMPVEFVPLDNETIIKDVNTGKVDAVAGMFYSEDKARYFDFTDVILRIETVLFIRKNINVSSIGKSDVVTGVVQADYIIDFLRSRFPGIKLEVYKSYTDLHKAVEDKKADAFVYAYPNIPWFSINPKAPDGYKKYAVLYSERIRAGVKKGNIKQLTTLNNGLILIKDEDLVSIGNKWKQILVKSHRFIMGDEELTILELTFMLTASFLFTAVILFFLYRLYRAKYKKIDLNLEDVIKEGESDSVEFKSSLRWDYRENAVNKVLEQVIIKTIAAFLNAKGGTLLIGVADDGTVLGLENDYKSFTKKQSRDGFILALTSLINQHIGKDFHRYISINIRPHEGMDVCVVTVLPGNTPVFLGTKEKEEFYIRAAASSQSLSLSETHKYIESRWKK